MKAIVLFITVFAAGLIQGVAGFGSGPVQMLTYPLYWPLPAAAAVSVCVSVPLNLNMVLTYRREIRWKKVVLPAIPYLAVCTAAIRFSVSLPSALLKKCFGAFLILLAGYYLFWNRREKTPLTPGKTALYLVVSALCDAFFGIGGPLMVLYYLNKTDSSREYLGTVAAFFLVNGLWNTAFRLASGILTAGHLPYAGLGMIGILLGVTAAHRLVDRIDGARLRKVTYAVIGLTGVLNLLS